MWSGRSDALDRLPEILIDTTCCWCQSHESWCPVRETGRRFIGLTLRRRRRWRFRRRRLLLLSRAPVIAWRRRLLRYTGWNIADRFSFTYLLVTHDHDAGWRHIRLNVPDDGRKMATTNDRNPKRDTNSKEAVSTAATRDMQTSEEKRAKQEILLLPTRDEFKVAGRGDDRLVKFSY